MTLAVEITSLAQKVKKASRVLAATGTTEKDRALQLMAAGLRDRRVFLQEKNRLDLIEAEKQGLSAAMIDRLTLSDDVIESMAAGLEEVASFADPVGEITRMWKRPNNLMVGKMRIPLGVIGMIYESRPNVTADAAGLCLKAGNGILLRGGSEAIHSNLAILEVLQAALRQTSIPGDVIQVIPLTDREAITEMLKLEEYIDLIIPRGGEGLIRFVVANSRIPVIKHYKGVCHVFVDEHADYTMARDIVINAKTQRPGVCNALETLLVHQQSAADFLPLIAAALKDAGVEVRACERSRAIVSDFLPATEEDWYAEYLSLTLAVRVVDDLDQAIDHINRYGSDHTEVIVTTDYHQAQAFLQRVNSSVVMVNASTRF
ncbi:MAG: glutamate-5-semialdehyde dehydrogenase, partial [Deltaproteobacteria bacterium]|nr:glutamate-5-semialdehyde dehydrogenase [Candidatus Tharpellaceae bacterium]